MTKHRQGAASVISMRLHQWEESGVLQNKKIVSLLLPSRNIIIGRQGGTRRSGSGPSKQREKKKQEQRRQKSSQGKPERVVPAEVSCPRPLVTLATGTHGSTCCPHCSMQMTKGNGTWRLRWKETKACRYSACDLSALAALKPHYQTVRCEVWVMNPSAMCVCGGWLGGKARRLE